MPSYYFYPSSSLRLGIVITEQSRKAFKIAPLWLKKQQPQFKRTDQQFIAWCTVLPTSSIQNIQLKEENYAVQYYNGRRCSPSCSLAMHQPYGYINPLGILSNITRPDGSQSAMQNVYLFFIQINPTKIKIFCQSANAESYDTEKWP